MNNFIIGKALNTSVVSTNGPLIEIKQFLILNRITQKGV